MTGTGQALLPTLNVVRAGLCVRGAAGIFIGALLVRLVCLFNFRSVPFFETLIVDSKAYDAWALRIVAGDWLGSTPFYQAPLYPYLMACFYKLAGHSILGLRLLQCVIGAASCVLLGQAAARFFCPAVGFVTGLLLAVYAPAAFLDPLVQKSVLDVFLLSFALLTLARVDAGKNLLPVFLLGVLFGLLALTRENALLIFPFVMLWILYHEKAALVKSTAYGKQLRRIGLVAGVLTLGLLVPLLPVTFRNVVLGARTAITTYNVGTSFYIGNGHRADGTYQPLRDDYGTTEFEESDARELAEAATGRKLGFDEISRYWLKRSFAEIAAAPGRWLKLMAFKAGLVFNRVELIDTDDIYFFEMFSPVLRMLNTIFNFGLLFPLAVAGMVFSFKDWRRHAILIIMAGAMFGSLIIFYVVARYRHAAMPMLLPYSAVALVHGRRALLQHESKRLVIPAIAFAVALTVAWLPLISKKDQIATASFNAAGVLAQHRQYSEAIHYYELAVQLGRGGPATFLNLGNALFSAGRFDNALVEYERALQHGAAASVALVNIGNALAMAGRSAESITAFQNAERQGASGAEFENAYGFALVKAGQTEAALIRLRRATELKPRYTSAWVNLAALLASQGDTTATMNAILQSEIAGADTKTIATQASRSAGEAGHSVLAEMLRNRH